MAMPVKVESVSIQPVPVNDNYVATIKSRKSATIQPQVSGNLTQIFVHSGDHVKAGEHLMEIDPRQQQAIVAQQEATEQQALAVYQYNQKDIARQQVAVFFRHYQQTGVSAGGAGLQHFQSHL